MLLQDCAVLGDIAAQEPDSIDAALERYERQRKPDVHALGTMDHQVCPPNRIQFMFESQASLYRQILCLAVG